VPFRGIFAFAAPVAGRLYQNGQVNSIGIIAEATSASSLPSLVFGGFSLVSLTVGSILFAIAIWRCGRFPKWSALAYAISTPLAAPSYNSVAFFSGGILLFAAGIGIAWRVRIEPRGEAPSKS